MKTYLCLVRHGKSSWKERSLPDIDRPLNPRGNRDAPVMAERLKNQSVEPDFMISSPAKRARATAEIFAASFGFLSDDIRTEDDIYYGSSAEILAVISRIAPDVRTLLVFGHNPVITDLAERLCGEPFGNIPTCGVVCIEFDIEEWGEIPGGTGRLVFFDYPKKLS